MPYYPETTVVMGLARITRERRLPPNAAPRPSHTLLPGSTAEAVNTVLEGDIFREYRILDVAEELRLRRPSPEQLAEIIMVKEGQRALVGQELARRGSGRRARVLASPAEGQVVLVDGSRIILQLSERTLEIKAGIPGRVEEADSRFVRLTGNGALIQCVWGNGGYVYTSYKFLPEGGFVALSKQDPRISEYRQTVLISPQPVDKGALLVAQQQQIAGVVAPSMASNLREFALQLTFPVLLTEGFGQRRPTALIYRLLQDNMGRQASFNASVPDHWSPDRPEIMIQLPSEGIVPRTPALDQPVRVGAPVRITRAPWDGLVGEVVELPTQPQRLANGLRLPCARVRLPDDRVEWVALANVELLGQPV
ncbi:MAG: hypothetical protein JXQ72_12845 [Anaerolineae bacterium]|nr:hypothetical protein [Anaerolineae bacterium]